MHIIGIFKLSSILITLLLSRKYLYYIIIEYEKDTIKG